MLRIFLANICSSRCIRVDGRGGGCRWSGRSRGIGVVGTRSASRSGSRRTCESYGGTVVGGSVTKATSPIPCLSDDGTSTLATVEAAAPRCTVGVTCALSSNELGRVLLANVCRACSVLSNNKERGYESSALQYKRNRRVARTIEKKDRKDQVFARNERKDHLEFVQRLCDLQ